MRRMRNIVVHAYFAVNLKILWQTVTEDLPKLKQQVDHLLNQLRPTLAERFGTPPTSHDPEPGREPDAEPEPA